MLLTPHGDVLAATEGPLLQPGLTPFGSAVPPPSLVLWPR